MNTAKLYSNYIYVLNDDLETLVTSNKEISNIFVYIPGLKKNVFKDKSYKSDLYLMNIDDQPVDINIIHCGSNYIVSVITLDRLQSLISEIERIRDIAIKDELTGVYNRHGYKMYLRYILERAYNSDKDVGLILVDIDDLKAVNTNSYIKGDKVIKGIANILDTYSRKNDYVIRIGGDEFMVAGLFDKNNSAASISKYIKRLLTLIRNANISTTVSMGAYIMTKKQIKEVLDNRHFAKAWDEYIQKLDTDLRIAKVSGKDKAYFDGKEIL